MQHKINTTTENVTANFIIFADSMQNFVLFLSRGLQTITTFWCQYIKCANKGAGKQQKTKTKCAPVNKKANTFSKMSNESFKERGSFSSSRFWLRSLVQMVRTHSQLKVT